MGVKEVVSVIAGGIAMVVANLVVLIHVMGLVVTHVIIHVLEAVLEVVQTHVMALVLEDVLVLPMLNFEIVQT